MKVKLNIARMCFAAALAILLLASNAAAQTQKQATGTVTVSIADNSIPVSSVTLNPTTISGGATSVATVTLNSAVQAGAVKVMLQSNSSHATVPSYVVVYQGNNSATFTILTTNVSSTTEVNIKATCHNVSQSATLTVVSEAVTGITFSPQTVVGASGIDTGTVALAGPAPYPGVTVNLSSNSSSASVSPSLTIPEGSTSGQFAINTNPVSSSTVATITATLSGSSTTAPLTILPYSVTGITFNPNPIDGGSGTTQGTVTLNAAAPSGSSVVVNLSTTSSNVTLPPTVTVSPSSTTGQFTVGTSTVATSTNATIRNSRSILRVSQAFR